MSEIVLGVEPTIHSLAPLDSLIRADGLERAAPRRLICGCQLGRGAPGP